MNVHPIQVLILVHLVPEGQYHRLQVVAEELGDHRYGVMVILVVQIVGQVDVLERVDVAIRQQRMMLVFLLTLLVLPSPQAQVQARQRRVQHPYLSVPAQHRFQYLFLPMKT